MEHIRLGAGNLYSSRLCFGAMGIGSSNWRPWVLDEEQALPVLERALQLGFTFFDTSDYYSKGESEIVLGRALRRLVMREEVIIATKVGNQMGAGPMTGGYSRKHILAAVDASLSRLGVDYIDLYQTHIWRPGTNMEEVISALQSLVEAGKIRYYGATDMPVWQFAKAHYAAIRHDWTGFATMQHHYNLVWREHESELVPMCQSEGIGLLPYSPLGRGFLASGSLGHERPTFRGQSDDFARKWYGRKSDQQVLAAVNRVAESRGVTSAAIALSWVLAKCPSSTPIIGATSVSQLDVVDDALSAQLTSEEINKLEAPYVPRL